MLPLCSPNEPVNLMRLLSMDYQQQWLEETRLKEEDERRKAKVRCVECYPTLLLCVVDTLVTTTHLYTGEAASCKEKA